MAFKSFQPITGAVHLTLYNSNTLNSGLVSIITQGPASTQGLITLYSNDDHTILGYLI